MNEKIKKILESALYEFVVRSCISFTIASLFYGFTIIHRDDLFKFIEQKYNVELGEMDVLCCITYRGVDCIYSLTSNGYYFEDYICQMCGVITNNDLKICGDCMNIHNKHLFLEHLGMLNEPERI